MSDRTDVIEKYRLNSWESTNLARESLEVTYEHVSELGLALIAGCALDEAAFPEVTVDWYDDVVETLLRLKELLEPADTGEFS
jgi:hypothetical protein